MNKKVKFKVNYPKEEKRKSSVFQGILDRRFNHNNTNRSMRDLNMFKSNPDLLSRKTEDGRRRSIAQLHNPHSLIK